MHVSVIICTYNRCDSLRRTLATCCDLIIHNDVVWELLVVDNNSTDATKQTCHEFSDKLPLRYIFEAKQGLSAARNRGINEASGELIVFTDDDVDIAVNWLSELWRAATGHPDAVFFGGKIIPQWDQPPPQWIEDSSKALLPGVVMCFDRGDSEHFLTPNEGVFYGANMAFRKTLFEKGAAFREDLGVNGAGRMSGEESELMVAFLAAGYKGFYAPKAVIYHRNLRNRMTERYVREWFIGYGMSEVRCGEVGPEHCWFGAPPYLWRRLVENTLKYVCTRWPCPSAVWLQAEINMATAWGMITELRRQARVGKQTSDRSQNSGVRSQN